MNPDPSYRSAEMIRQVVTEDWRCEMVADFSKGDTQGFAFGTDAFLVIALRGTESPGDWMDNLKLFAKGRPYGRIHRGFFEAWNRIADQAGAVATEAAAQDKTIWLTGHSLGGALALTAALELPDTIPLAGLMTFGQPRLLGNHARSHAQHHLASIYQRFVNNDDLVPRLPPHYGHAGALIRFGTDGTVPLGMGYESAGATAFDAPPVSEAEFAEIQTEIRAVKTDFAATTEAPGIDSRRMTQIRDAAIETLLPGLADHRIDTYIALIARQAKAATADLVAAIETLRPLALPTTGATERRSRRGFDRLLRDLIPSVSQPRLTEFRHSPLDEIDILGRLSDRRTAGISFPDSNFSTRRLAPKGWPQTDFENFLKRESLPELPSRDEAFALPLPDVSTTPSPPDIPLLLRLRRADWSPPEGVRLHSRIGGIVTAQATEAAIPVLKLDPEVISLEFSRDAGHPDLDRSAEYVGARAVQRPPIAERGDAALIGFLDTGIDILHRTFLDAAGKTRIVALWDQSDPTGPTPHATDPQRFTQDYGTLLGGAEIDALIAAFEAGTPLPPILRDPLAHGTHVAGIAAGRATGQMPDGIAPEARIAMVIPHMKTAPKSPPSLGYSNSHADGVGFLWALAQGGNTLLPKPLPLAVNLSLGMNAGAHDGLSILETALDTITGNGQTPGCVIVKSAGNQRGSHAHARIIATLGQNDIFWRSKDIPRAQDYFELWFKDLDELAFTLVDPQGRRSDLVSADAPLGTISGAPNLCRLVLIAHHDDNADTCLRITIAPGSAPILTGRWQLEVLGYKIRSEDAAVDIWCERNDDNAVAFEPSDEHLTLTVPATALRVVTVGACDTGDYPRLIAMSSYGPTRDNRNKPELSAPGLAVLSAAAGSPDRNAVRPETGTSMAAPHVAGALALVMSRLHKTDPASQMNAINLLKAARRTVRNFTHKPHPGAGYGVLDIKALFADLFD